MMGLLGVALLVVAVLWSTGQLHLPGPLATLRTVPEQADEADVGPSSVPARLDRGREFRERLLNSIWREQLVTITAHVALCDHRMSKVANPAQGRGDNYRENLYWGAAYGVETFFSRQSDWSVLGMDSGTEAPIMKRVVFIRSVNPTNEWRQRGVTKPFEICLLALAWPGPRAADAMRATLNDALGLRPPRVINIGGRKLTFGSGSDLIGYIGYNALKDGHNILPRPAATQPKPEPRGVFFICPPTPGDLSTDLRVLGLQPVLLATQYITPEAYILYGLTEALAAGQIEGGFALHAAQQYAHYRAMALSEARSIFTQ